MRLANRVCFLSPLVIAVLSASAWGQWQPSGTGKPANEIPARRIGIVAPAIQMNDVVMPGSQPAPVVVAPVTAPTFHSVPPARAIQMNDVVMPGSQQAPVVVAPVTAPTFQSVPAAPAIQLNDVVIPESPRAPVVIAPATAPTFQSEPATPAIQLNDVVMPESPKAPVIVIPTAPTSQSEPRTPEFLPSPSANASTNAPTFELLPFEEKAIAADEGWTPKFKFKPGDTHLLQMETENKQIKFFAGGRLQIDAAWMNGTTNMQFGRDGIGRLDDAVNFRRARYVMGGTLFENIDFEMEWDFINTTNAERVGSALAINTPVPTDMWVNFKNIPFFGNLRIGNQKPPTALEHMTSSRFLNFLERSLAFDAFIENQNNGFEPGILLFNQYLDQRMWAGVGVFKNTRSIFGWNVGDGEYDITGRLAFLPIWEDDGRYLMHLGISASHADLDDHVARYRARILIRNGPATLHNIVAEAQMVGSSRDMVIPEFAMNCGPFTLAAEYYAVWTHDVQTPVATTGTRTNRGTTYFQGGYVEALYFLTGEHRGYDRGRFAWGRQTPNNNWKPWGTGCDVGGIGAWQLAARYDWLNLNDNGVHGNIVHDWTLGLNWFLNPYMKFQWNYTLEYRSAQFNKGYIQAFGTRLAMDF
jgi:phosphate-selective porin OprO and OprP